MSIHSEIRLHEALRHAHGLPHHVREWLAGQPTRKIAGTPPTPKAPDPQPAPAASPAPRAA
jgi:hypothetical protein